MSDHSFIPPSSAGVWVKCPMWPQMNQAFPRESGEAAKEGTVVHTIGEKMIKRSLAAVGYGQSLEPFPDYIEGSMVDGVIVTSDMIKAAELYAEEAVRAMHISGQFLEPYIGIEERVGMPMVHPENYGTLDFYCVFPKMRSLVVQDLKYGYGVVEATDNWQLIDYAAGVMQRLVDLKVPVGISTITLKVVQPRAYHKDGPVRSHTITATELWDRVAELNASAEEAHGPNPRAVTGRHCRYCPGRHCCEAALRAGVDMWEAVVEGSGPVDMTAESLAAQYTIIQEALDRLGYVNSGLEAQLEAMIRNGQRVPGYDIVSHSGKRVWNKSAADIKNLGALLGVEMTKEVLISPKQAEDAGMDKDAVAANCKSTYTNKLKVVDKAGAATKIFK